MRSERMDACKRNALTLCRRGSGGEPSPGTDVAGVSPVLVQTWQGCTHRMLRLPHDLHPVCICVGHTDEHARRGVEQLCELAHDDEQERGPCRTIESVLRIPCGMVSHTA
jgi:hypothetical protein